MPDQAGAAAWGARAACAGSSYSARSVASSIAAGSPPSPCEPEQRNANPSLGTLRLQARATFQDQPATVLVFDKPDDPANLRVIVVAEGDCGTVLMAEDVPT